MPRFCHGKGNPDTDGCCWVNGQVCGLRLKIVNGRVLEGPQLVDRGTIAQYAATLGAKQVRDRATAQLTGPVIACRVAVTLIAKNGALLTDRPALDAAWIGHADYQAQVRPVWTAVEQRQGLPAGTLDCPEWHGSGTPQCCYAEDEATNLTRRADLSTAAVTVRQNKAL